MTEESKKSQKNETVNRRSYLKATAGAAGIAAFGLNAAAADGDYEEIVVGEGETYSVHFCVGRELQYQRGRRRVGDPQRRSQGNVRQPLERLSDHTQHALLGQHRRRGERLPPRGVRTGP